MEPPSPILPPSSPPPAGSPWHVATFNPLEDPREVSEGRVLAALGYVIWIVALIVLIVRNNAFSLYHAKQQMALTIVHTALSIPLVCVFFGVMIFMGANAPRTGSGAQAGPPPAFICSFLGMWGIAVILGLWGLAMMIVGLVNSISGKAKPLPLYGMVADKLFGGVQKKRW